jgi:hypothetical protein
MPALIRCRASLKLDLGKAGAAWERWTQLGESAQLAFTAEEANAQ